MLFDPASAVGYDPTQPIPRVAGEMDDVFPNVGILHSYMAWVVPTTHAPPLYHLGAILPALAFECARRGITIGGRLPRVWTCLVGGSAGGKSTAHTEAQDFVNEWQQTIRSSGYLDPYLHLDGSMPGILAASSAYWNVDAGATVAIYETDEMSKILSQLDSVAETLCKVFDGRTITRQLRQYQIAKQAGEKVDDQVKKPAISAALATTPSSLERVTQSYHLEGGLFSRILWFRGNLRPGELQPRRIARTAARDAALGEWRGWAAWLDGVKTLGGDVVVQTPPDVYELFDTELFGQWRERLVEDHDRVNSARLRAIPYAETIAGLFAISRGALLVTDDDAVRAINLVEQCVATLTSLDKTVAVDVDAKLRDRVMTIVAAAHSTGCPKTVIYQGTRSSKIALDLAIGTLLDAGLIEKVPQPPKPGRQMEVYRKR